MLTLRDIGAVSRNGFLSLFGNHDDQRNKIPFELYWKRTLD
jgi:hypothetical protein